MSRSISTDTDLTFKDLLHMNNINVKLMILIFGILTPLSAIFQLYHGDQF
jgi:hypothetical protein